MRFSQPPSAPRVSVIVPVFNREELIGRCLRSLLTQTMPAEGYEIIVVDDGSSDRSRFSVELFIAKQDSLVRLISHDSNQGLPAALNTGIRRARGDMIVRVDSDDFVSNHFLLSLFLFLDLNPAFAAVECDYEVVDDAEHVVRRVVSTEEPIGCGIMFRTDLITEVGLYDESILIHEEREFRTRFEANHRIEHLPLPLYRYRRHSHGGLTQSPAA